MSHSGRVLALCAVAVCGGCDARLAVTIRGEAVELQDARLELAVYVDDGEGCEALRFHPAPSTAPLSVVVVDAGSVVVPRLGDKIIVAEAANDTGVIGRGCVEVGEVNESTRVALVVTPTTSLRDVPTTTPVFGDVAGTVTATVIDAANTPRADIAVQARVLDGRGAVVQDEVLISDDDGAVSFAPVLTNSGPVIVELVPQQPATADDRALLDAWVAAPSDDIVLPAGTQVLPAVLDDGPQFVTARAVDDDAIELAHLSIDGSQRSALVSADPAALQLLSVQHHDSLGGTDLDRDLIWVQTPQRLMAIDLSTLTVVDELTLTDDRETFAALLVGDCRAPAHHGPVLMTHSGRADIVDVAFDRITFVEASSALVTAVRSGCVVDDGGGSKRVVVTVDGAYTLGAGIASIRVAAVPAEPVIVDDPGAVVHIGFRADHTALVVRFDGGSTVLTPYRLQGARLVPHDAVDAVPQRLPATPLLVQQGALFGGDHDVVALLPAGGPNDSAALYGRSGEAASGVVGICSPRTSCIASVVSDVDDDGVLDLLTVAATPTAVRARIVRSR